MSSQTPLPAGHGGASGPNGVPRRAFPVRARDLLKVRAVWILPLVLGCVVVALITAFYVGSVVDPLAHLSGLPVTVVNQDRGAMIGTQRVNIGQQVQRGLSGSTAVSGKLALTDTTLSSAQQAMDRGASYATVVIPPGFTASLLNLAGVSAGGAGSDEAIAREDDAGLRDYYAKDCGSSVSRSSRTAGSWPRVPRSPASSPRPSDRSSPPAGPSNGK
jgi:YhgE/Pip-like protein